MKKLKSILIALSFIAIFSGCKKEPTACFTVEWLNDAKVKLDATCSKDVEIYSWSCSGPNGSTADCRLTTNESAANQSYVTYTLGYVGFYEIKLTVNNDGLIKETTQTIRRTK